VGKTLDDDENDKLSDAELIKKLKQGMADADKWNEENPDPKR
jgi:hypothetical protein